MARPADRADGRARMVELRAVEAGFPVLRPDEAGRRRSPTRTGCSRTSACWCGRNCWRSSTSRSATASRSARSAFTIRGVHRNPSPGRRLGAFSIGPRVFVDLADLEKTGLLGFGSRAAMQRLLEGARRGVRQADCRLARRLRESVRARALVQGHRGRHRRGLHARRELPQPGRPGDRHPRRHRRVERDARVRAAEDEEHRGAQVRRRALGAAAGGVCGAGRGARPGRQPARGAAGGAGDARDPVAAGRRDAGRGDQLRADAGRRSLQGLGIGLLVSLLFSLVPLLDVRHVKPSLLLRDEARSRRPDVTQIVVTRGRRCRPGRH